MPTIPIHKVVQQSDFGIYLKEVSPFSSKSPINYIHQDDYYIFGMVDSGKCSVSIDFKNYHLSESEIICTQPHQVHHVTNAGNAKTFLLFIDSVFIDSETKQILAEYALSLTPFKITDQQRFELEQLFAIILHRINDSGNNKSKHIIQNLARAAVGIITETIQGIIRQQSKNKRHIEITLAFKELLSKELHVEKRISHYAKSLHISPVYLNEAIKSIAGISVSKYIQIELMLRAKRMLIYTSLNIKEIAINLGFDDYAYFTRLFTKATGLSPTSYRKKYLE